MKRGDGRAYDEIRPVKITTGFQSFAEGSALIELGKTCVLTAVSVEDRVPPFMKGQGTGWLTAEYSMLPRATPTRSVRDAVTGHIAGRSQEIQRLIGRSLRAVVDFELLGERTIWVDCDVLQADGGTRTAAITGAWIAVHDALRWLESEGVRFARWPLLDHVAAVSVGIISTSEITLKRGRFGWTVPLPRSHAKCDAVEPLPPLPKTKMRRPSMRARSSCAIT